MLHRSAYLLSRALGRHPFAAVVRMHVTGRDPTAAGGPMVIGANHISHFDPLLLSLATRGEIDWMAMAELFEIPVVGPWARAVNAFPVDRSRVDRGAVRTALKRLRAGRIVGVFPEGGIRDGAASVLGGAALRPGIGALAQLTGAPLVPVVILGTDRLYSWRAWLPGRRTPVWIGFGEPLRCSGPAKGDRHQCEEGLTEALRSLAAKMRSEYGLKDEDFPQTPARRKGRE